MTDSNLMIVYALLVANIIPITVSILLKKKKLVYILCLLELLFAVSLILLSKQVVF